MDGPSRPHWSHRNRRHLRGVSQEAPQGEGRGNVTVDALTDLERQRIAHEERAAQVARDPLGEHADRFPEFDDEHIRQETRNVRLDIAFEDRDPVNIRQQAEMAIGFLRDVIDKTKESHLGQIKIRIEARRIADAGRRQLARFNGKTPHGDTYRRRRNLQAEYAAQISGKEDDRSD